MTKSMLVGYVVKTFPAPSETFIADEAASLRSAGARAVVLHLQDGDRSVVHASAAELIASKATRLIDARPKREVLRALLKLFWRRPISTVGNLLRVGLSAQRWRHARSLPHAAWCLEAGVDYLHAHFADLNLEYAAILSQWTGIPYGVTTHRYDIFEDPLEPALAAKLMRGAALQITISEFNKRHLLGKYKIPESYVQVVHCGVDLSRFHFSIRPAYDGSRHFRVLSVGRLVPVKGHDVLIQAMAILVAEGRRIKTQIIGSGPEQNRLQHLIDTFGLRECVQLLGAQRHDQVQQHLAEADAFVLASHSEGIPVACMETMACGTPIIATQITGLPELVDNGYHGLLVPPNDPPALAKALSYLMDHPEESAAMASAARSKIEAEFNRELCSERLVSLIRTALLNSRAPNEEQQ